ncbi:hypothetical protein Tco_0656481 [Tanacetum coccineum]|uniref:Gag-Pol polyprotein n=1 Tax=Tanacetum coccineum TaxID=301880 RepID=A0ABQ4X8V4_9ASTR
MSTPVSTSSTDSQMHNNIMAAGSKDRPPMLGPGRYSQWRSRFLRYIDTKNNGEGLKKCILNGPYVPTSVLIQAVPEAEGRPAVQQHTAIETVLNMTPENKEHFQSEKEAIFLLLTGIGDEIYSTVDACNTANEMWIAIERLQQGESLNVQDVKTNLFWEFGKFTSRDGESMESYYSRFYKLMNELTRNNLQVTLMQVNVQFLQQLQPEWSRFVTIVKQSEKSKSANPLALIAAAQPYSDNYYQATKPQRSTETTLHKDQSASTDTKAKRSPNQLHLNSGLVSEEDSDLNKLRGDKDLKRILALIAKYLRSFTKPTTTTFRNFFKLQDTRLEDNTQGNGERKAGLKDYAFHKEKMVDVANKLNKEVYLKDPVLLVSHWQQKDDSNVTLDSSNICTNDNQVDQNVAECVDERAALANLIANLTLPY